MSIAYNTGIPAANNNPSTDQPNMLINTNSINTWVAVDHIGFNVGGSQVSGQHAQVTYNAPLGANPNQTSPIASLYTKTDSGATQLFFQNDNGASFVRQMSFATPTNLVNGGTAGGTLYKIPLGFLGITIYAGETASFSGTRTVIFSTPFTTIISSSVSAQTAGANVTVTAIQNNASLTIGTSGAVAVNWIAIGVL